MFNQVRIWKGIILFSLLFVINTEIQGQRHFYILPGEYYTGECTSDFPSTDCKYGEGDYKYSVLDEYQKSGFYDIDGFWRLKIKEPKQFAAVSRISEGLVVLNYTRDYNFQGYFNSDGEIKLNGFIDPKTNIKTSFSDKYVLSDFSEGLARIRKYGDNKNKDGFIDKDGKLVIPMKFEYALDFKDGLARVFNINKYGFIDVKGNIKIPMKYNLTSSFSEGLAAVKLNNKWGYINKKGEIVVPLIYSSALDFHEGFARVGSNNKYGFINNKGNKIITPIYDFTTNFKNGKAVFRKGKKWGLVNNNGIEVAGDFDNCLEVNDKILIAEKEGSYFIINREGKRVSDTNYNYIKGISPERLVARLGAKYLFLNESGDPLNNIFYDELSGQYFYDYKNQGTLEWSSKNFNAALKSGNLLMHSRNGKYGLMTYMGKEITPAIYSELSFMNGIIKCKLNNQYIYLNKFGTEINLSKYNQIWDFTNDVDNLGVVSIIDKNKYKYGVIDELGREVIPPIYDQTFFCQYGQCIMGLKSSNTNNIQYGVVNLLNQVVIPFEHNPDELVLSENNRYIVKKAPEKVVVAEKKEFKSKGKSTTPKSTSQSTASELDYVMPLIFGSLKYSEKASASFRKTESNVESNEKCSYCWKNHEKSYFDIDKDHYVFQDAGMRPGSEIHTYCRGSGQVRQIDGGISHLKKCYEGCGGTGWIKCRNCDGTGFVKRR
jgi:hypothetical protein